MRSLLLFANGVVNQHRNIISGGPSSIIRKPGTSRSNLELTNSLRNNFLAAQQDYGADAAAAAAAAAATASTTQENGDSTINGNGKRTHSPQPQHHSHAPNGSRPNGKKTAAPAAATAATDIWTAREGGSGPGSPSVLYIPRIDWSSAGLQEERSQYEITVKLFYLPTGGSESESVSAVVADRARYTSEALSLVKRELGDIGDIDLLIVSFPGISFEGDCEWEADRRNAAMGSDAEERATWAGVLAPLHQRGEVGRLGLAEFGSEKLRRFLHDSKDKEEIRVRPAVDQINVKNCCSVPPPLTQLAKEEGIELFTHNDCTDILPSGTLRELLGQGAQGAGVLAADDDEGRGDGLRGDLIPQWVVKYTAVVKDRGVIENKGYFAGAELIEA